jgi:magnesium-transporting ATPase (P-type)
LIAYGLTASQKALIVSLIRSKLLHHPTVCAIGLGFNDVLMMQNSNVSIELNKKNDFVSQINSLSNGGDIIIERI